MAGPSWDFQLDWGFDRAEDGNVAMIGEVNLASGREFTVGMIGNMFTAR